MRRILVLALVVLATACATDDGRTLQDPTFDPPLPPTTLENGELVVPDFTNGVGGMAIVSPAFEPGDPIPSVHAAAGDNTSPPFTFSMIPDGVAELALVVTNPDSDNAIHWVVTGIDPSIGSLPEGSLPDGAEEHTSHFGVENWVGPNTPAGETHRYVFNLYGLADPIDINDNFSTNDTVELIRQRAATGATATIMGTHQG